MTATTGATSITRRHVSLEAAVTLIDAARACARQLGVPSAIAVVDADGSLKAFERMDGAGLLPVRIAQQKAWTAISVGIPTTGVWDMIRDDPPLLHGIVHQQEAALLVLERHAVREHPENVPQNVQLGLERESAIAVHCGGL